MGRFLPSCLDPWVDRNPRGLISKSGQEPVRQNGGTVGEGVQNPPLVARKRVEGGRGVAPLSRQL